VVDALRDEYGVERGRPGRARGFSHLVVDGKPFARLSPRHSLVVRLPEQRVDDLIASGAGRRFESLPRRVRQEWLVVEGESLEEWVALAREAAKFVRARA